MKIALGTDHAGFPIKQAVKAWLTAAGHEPVDFGAYDAERSDYPPFVIRAAEAVRDGEAELGVVFGGSGNGEAIAANKVLGIRCAVCWDVELGRLAREHNNANVISLPGRFVTPQQACDIVSAWLHATYEGGRHDARLAYIASYEGRA